jgi:hypothetical protein
MFIVLWCQPAQGMPRKEEYGICPDLLKFHSVRRVISSMIFDDAATHCGNYKGEVKRELSRDPLGGMFSQKLTSPEES